MLNVFVHNGVFEVILQAGAKKNFPLLVIYYAYLRFPNDEKRIIFIDFFLYFAVFWAGEWRCCPYMDR